MRRLLSTLGILAILPFMSALADPVATGQQEKKEGEKATPAKPRIAVFRLAGRVTESEVENPFSFGSPPGLTLKDLVARMKKAAGDPEVKAVVLLPDGGSMGLAQVEELRQAMKRLRSAGKGVYAHADSLGMGQYTLLSGASRISVVPTGSVWVTGVAGEAPYLRGLLDILGIAPDFLSCGDYKSAAEIFLRTGPSAAAEEMENWLFDGMYDNMVGLIARGRGLKPEKVRALIDEGPYLADGAKKAGLIDAVEHLQAFEAVLKAEYGKDVVFDKRYGQKRKAGFDFTSPLAPFKAMAGLMGKPNKKPGGKAAIAVVYVDGPIVLGGGQPSPFSGTVARSSEIRKALDEAARDDSIKAVVLRVDSPGGSAVASEVILDATRRVKAKKPFAVSMGDVAGSGGYYVACGADTIFANESTLTGSIGVVSGKFVTTDMWKKVGVTFKPYRRGKNAAMLGSGSAFSERERERVQGVMDEIYGVFKGHVVAIRGKRLAKPIDDLAGGRVYTGRQALKLGLVDKIGTLRDAIEHLAAQAKLDDYEIRTVPEAKPLIERVLEQATGAQDDVPGLDAAGPRLPPPGRQSSLVNLAMPHLRELDPQRVRLIVRALERLQLMQQEGVTLMMAEMQTGR